jgi:hypothetical protein
MNWTLKIYYITVILLVLTLYFVIVYCKAWELYYLNHFQVKLTTIWEDRFVYWFKITIDVCMITNVSSVVVMCATIY